MREDVKMSRCERRCEDEKMFYRPPLLEEPCAQTLSGKTTKKQKNQVKKPTRGTATATKNAVKTTTK